MEKPEKPASLWFCVAMLGVMTLIQLMLGVRRGSEVLLVAVVLNTAILTGLILGHKWAYVVLLVFSVLGPLLMLFVHFWRGVAALFMNSLVVIPLLLATRYFFPWPLNFDANRKLQAGKEKQPGPTGKNNGLQSMPSHETTIGQGNGI